VDTTRLAGRSYTLALVSGQLAYPKPESIVGQKSRLLCYTKPKARLISI
jgi:hypothetical protein